MGRGGRERGGGEALGKACVWVVVGWGDGFGMKSVGRTVLLDGCTYDQRACICISEFYQVDSLPNCGC
jgi:hypothetical protein